MMIDRSVDFNNSVVRFDAQVKAGQLKRNENVASRRTPKSEQGSSSNQNGHQQTNQTFVTGSIYISQRLDALAKKIKGFVKESERRRLYEDAGLELARSGDVIKRELEALSKGIQGLNRIIQRTTSKQVQKHYGIILETLRKRFGELTKEFQDHFQQRTKAVSMQKAKQEKRFGGSKVQLSTPNPTRVSVFNPALNRPSVPGPNGMRGANSNMINNNSNNHNSNNNHHVHSNNNNNNNINNNYPPPRPGPPMPNAFGSGGPSIRRRGMGGPDTNSSSPTHQGGYQNGFASNNNNNNMNNMGRMAPAVPTFNPYASPDEYGQSKKYDGETHFGARQMAQYDRSAYDQSRRAAEVQSAEKQLNEISSLYSKVTELVVEQGEIVDRIDDDIHASLDHVTAGQSELLKYYQNLSSERQFIIKILIVTICLASFFIIAWR